MFTTTAANIAAQSQADLFGDDDPAEFQLTAPRAPLSERGWVGHRGPFGRNLRWTHAQLPDLEIRHCGHPTALRPYYVQYQSGEISQRKFPRLADAIAYVITEHRKGTP